MVFNNCVVWAHDSFQNKLYVFHKFMKYLKGISGQGCYQHFALKSFHKKAQITKKLSKIFRTFLSTTSTLMLDESNLSLNGLTDSLNNSDKSLVWASYYSHFSQYPLSFPLLALCWYYPDPHCSAWWGCGNPAWNGVLIQGRGAEGQGECWLYQRRCWAE